jgi:hypothetical protein
MLRLTARRRHLRNRPQARCQTRSVAAAYSAHCAYGGGPATQVPCWRPQPGTTALQLVPDQTVLNMKTRSGSCNAVAQWAPGAEWSWLCRAQVVAPGAERAAAMGQELRAVPVTPVSVLVTPGVYTSTAAQAEPACRRNGGRDSGNGATAAADLAATSVALAAGATFACATGGATWAARDETGCPRLLLGDLGTGHLTHRQSLFRQCTMELAGRADAVQRHTPSVVHELRLGPFFLLPSLVISHIVVSCCFPRCNVERTRE